MKNALIVGGGSIGERHLRCFLNTGRVTASLCDVDENLLAKLKQKYPIQQTFTNFEQALDAGPDLVVICTPAHLAYHDEAQACVDRDIPVLIEKPLSTSFDGIEQLANSVAEKKLPVAVAYVTFVQTRSCRISVGHSCPDVLGNQFNSFRTAVNISLLSASLQGNLLQQSGHRGRGHSGCAHSWSQLL
ncbi:MAG: Gfo/Idh/MocA family oxidoreductase [Planctomycetaceae bacterium]